MYIRSKEMGGAREGEREPWGGREGSRPMFGAVTGRRRPGSEGEWRALGETGRRTAATARSRRRVRGRALGLWIGSALATPFSPSLPPRRRRGLQREGKLGKKVAEDAEGMREHMVWPSKEYGPGMGWASKCGAVRTKEFRFRATKPGID